MLPRKYRAGDYIKPFFVSIAQSNHIRFAEFPVFAGSTGVGTAETVFHIHAKSGNNSGVGIVRRVLRIRIPDTKRPLNIAEEFFHLCNVDVLINEFGELLSVTE